VDDGESFTHGPFTLQIKYLRHGLFKGMQNLGVVISTDNFSFAHCGDATDFQGFPMIPVDVLAVPIVGGFTSGPGKSTKMVMNLADPKPVIVPMHWLFRNPTSFCKKLRNQMPEIKCVVPIVGEPLKL
jgi:L-ascorbate metabolism protein UlaG (beta-lactamase superfamily)